MTAQKDIKSDSPPKATPEVTPTKADPKKPEPTKSPEGVKPPKKDRPYLRWLLIAMGVFFAMLVGSALGYFGNERFGETAGETGDEVSECDDEEGADDEEEDEDDEEEADESPCPVCGEEHPSYTLNIGGTSTLTVPEGWYVSEVIGDYEAAPDELMNALPMVMADGTVFISEKASVTITNGSSSITISDFPPYVPGPFGVTPGDLDPGFVVVLEPTVDTNGFAREQTGDTYGYRLVYFCEDPAICTDYAVFDDPFELYFEYEGGLADLELADDLFEETMIDSTFDFRE